MGKASAQFGLSASEQQRLATVEREPDRKDALTENRHKERPRVLRYLTRVGEEQPFAYAPNRRDFYLSTNDSLWAHESHDWLLEADSGAALAHRTGGAYYDIDTGEIVFVESSTPTTSGVDIDVRDVSGT